MSNIFYTEINQEIEDQIVEVFGEWVTKYGCLHYGEGCCSIAALYNEKPVGFISTYPLRLPAPLRQHVDAYIDDIEVHENFRRQGIARELLLRTEKWAKKLRLSSNSLMEQRR